ncbi:MAG: hypothetical protein JXR63_12955 [Spirochaetales bacterium]|nr:hypothetical protein [Spirochaetales bacterium]
MMVLNEGEIFAQRYKILSVVESGSLCDIYNVIDLYDSQERKLHCYSCLFSDLSRNQQRSIKKMNHTVRKSFFNIVESPVTSGVYRNHFYLTYNNYFFIENKSPLPWFIALKIFIEMVIGLIPLHRKHCYLGFLLPERIVFWDQTFPLSHSRYIGAYDSCFLTNASDSIVKSSGFIHSDCLYQKQSLNAAHDIFSLGRIFFFLITGKIPSLNIDDNLSAIKKLKETLPSSVYYVLKTLNKADIKYKNIIDLHSDLSEIVLYFLKARISGFAGYCDFAIKQFGCSSCDVNSFYISLEECVELPKVRVTNKVLSFFSKKAAVLSDTRGELSDLLEVADFTKVLEENHRKKMAKAESQKSKEKKVESNGKPHIQVEKNSDLETNSTSEVSSVPDSDSVDYNPNIDYEKEALLASQRVKAVIDAMNAHYKKDRSKEAKKATDFSYMNFYNISDKKAKNSIDYIRGSLEPNRRSSEVSEDRRKARDEVLTMLEKFYSPETEKFEDNLDPSIFAYDFSNFKQEHQHHDAFSPNPDTLIYDGDSLQRDNLETSAVSHQSDLSESTQRVDLEQVDEEKPVKSAKPKKSRTKKKVSYPVNDFYSNLSRREFVSLFVRSLFR